MILYIIILIVLFLIGGFCAFIEDYNSAIPYGFIGGILIGTVVSCALILCSINTIPTALDVYQGKTTLEVTCKDSIPVDTVVVLKDKN
jgi:hypothetical protein